MQLLLLIDELAGDLDQRKQTNVVMMDLCKALDKVPLQRLLLNYHNMV